MFIESLSRSSRTVAFAVAALLTLGAVPTRSTGVSGDLGQTGGGSTASGDVHEPPTIRGGVELFVVRILVDGPRDQPLPELDGSSFAVRIGRRTPPILHAEQVPIPPEGERRTGPFAFFQPAQSRVSALYLLGIDPDEADCRQVPRVTVAAEGVRIRGVAWGVKPGCEPPRARIVGSPRPQ